MKGRAGRDQQRGPRAEGRRPRVGTASPVRRHERRLVRGVERRGRGRGFAGVIPPGRRALPAASERAQHSFQRVQGPFLLHAAPRHEPRIRRVQPVRESRSRSRRGGRKPCTSSRSRGFGDLRSRRLRCETAGDDGPRTLRGLPGCASKRQPGGEGPNVRLEGGEGRGLLRGYVRAESFRPGPVLLVPRRFRITPGSPRKESVLGRLVFGHAETFICICASRDAGRRRHRGVEGGSRRRRFQRGAEPVHIGDDIRQLAAAPRSDRLVPQERSHRGEQEREGIRAAEETRGGGEEPSRGGSNGRRRVAQRGRRPLRGGDHAALPEHRPAALVRRRLDGIARIARLARLVLLVVKGLSVRLVCLVFRNISDHLRETFQRPRDNLVGRVREAPLDARQQERLARRRPHELAHARDVPEERRAQRPRPVVEAGDQERDQKIVGIGAAEKTSQLLRAGEERRARRGADALRPGDRVNPTGGALRGWDGGSRRGGSRRGGWYRRSSREKRRPGRRRRRAADAAVRPASRHVDAPADVAADVSFADRRVAGRRGRRRRERAQPEGESSSSRRQRTLSRRLAEAAPSLPGRRWGRAVGGEVVHGDPADDGADRREVRLVLARAHAPRAFASAVVRIGFVKVPAIRGTLIFRGESPLKEPSRRRGERRERGGVRHTHALLPVPRQHPQRWPDKLRENLGVARGKTLNRVHRRRQRVHRRTSHRGYAVAAHRDAEGHHELQTRVVVGDGGCGGEEVKAVAPPRGSRGAANARTDDGQKEHRAFAPRPGRRRRRQQRRRARTRASSSSSSSRIERRPPTDVCGRRRGRAGDPNPKP
mmetsp:Transcript_3371/g.15066  ORF Transcript_3371/g.15066 Transcript_3371/m.15066 type:complete len:825 (-) Transcript_3371:1968-4442(-)